MTAADLLTTYRPTLLAIAYRMTGQITLSEDLVQQVLLTWMSRSPELVRDPKAYLARSVVHASLNYLAQVKRQRQAYKGVWLPEPVLTPHPRIDARLDIGYGLLLVMEKLTPLERAIFVLRESFDFAHTDLASLFETSPANCRQVYRRAKAKMAVATGRPMLDSSQQQALLEAFVQASETGNMEPLIQWLKADVVLYSDGGGKVVAAREPLVGVVKVAHFLRNVAAKFGSQWRMKPGMVNGQIALFFAEVDNHRLTTVLVVEADPWGIGQLYLVRNPDKLAHLA